MALSDFQTEDSVARSRRGSVNRNLGGTAVVSPALKQPNQGLLQKAGAVTSQTGNILAIGAVKGAQYIKNAAVDIAGSAYGTARSASNVLFQPVVDWENNRYSHNLDDIQQNAMQAYRSGKMSQEDYKKQMESIAQAQSELSKRATYKSPIDWGDVANTAVNYLSLGSASLAEVGGKEALQAGSKEALTALVDQAATPLEQTAMKIPAVKALIMRNLEQGAKREAQILAGETVDQFLVRSSRQVAVNLLIKRPIFYQSNIAQTKSLYDHILKGEYKGALTDAAWLGSQMVEGGPIGFFSKNASIIKGGLKKLAHGNESFIDIISSQIGNKNSSQWSRYLQTLEKRAPNAFKESENISRIAQETNLRMSGNDAKKAAQNLLIHYEQNGYDLANVSPGQIIKDLGNWQKADELAQQTLRSGLVKGINPEDASKYVVVRWDQGTRNAIASAFRNAPPELQARGEILQALANQPAAGWANNETLMNRLNEILSQEQTGKDVERAIQSIDAGSLDPGINIPKKVANQLSELGFTIAAPVGGRVTPIVEGIDDTRKLVTAAINGHTDIFDPATAAQPQMAAIAGALQRAGLSPESSNRVATQKLSQSLVANLDELGIGQSLGLKNTQGGDLTKGGQAILSKLQNYIENKRGVFGATKSAVTDIRQLTHGEVAEALKISNGEAKKVSQAIMQGYLDVPLEFRGLGDKVTDYLFAANPLQKYYSRVQSALRYTYNPFFRAQERAETKILAHVQASNLVWNKSKGELDEAARVLDEAGIFSSSLPGEAAQDQVFGRLTANITQGQKRDLAGLAGDIAEARGITVEQLARENPDDIDDALRVVVQYPRKGILASPLARTMNLAFFPMRYNLKVTQVAAQALGKQPPAVQKAVLHSMFQMKNWLKSDEGIAWQSAHADAIQVFNWITPINSIEYTLNLLGHKPDSVSDVGQLGGLPLGIITQILDGQGIINLNRPYVNPKTGDVIPKYIPDTTKARAATALGDLLNSTFTYPGRTLGLPGKSETIRNVVKSFIDTNGTDFIKEDEMGRLTPLQQNWVRVLQGDTSKEAIDALYSSPAPSQYNGYTLPPLTAPVTRRTNLPSKASKSTKKAKKIAVPISSAR